MDRGAAALAGAELVNIATEKEETRPSAPATAAARRERPRRERIIGGLRRLDALSGRGPCPVQLRVRRLVRRLRRDRRGHWSVCASIHANESGACTREWTPNLLIHQICLWRPRRVGSLSEWGRSRGRRNPAHGGPLPLIPPPMT